MDPPHFIFFLQNSEVLEDNDEDTLDFESDKPEKKQSKIWVDPQSGGRNDAITVHPEPSNNVSA